MRGILLLCLATLLYGCATLKDEVASVNAVETPAELKSWRMDGRIGVQARDTAWQANLNWDHEATQDRLRISGPFSQGVVSIIVQKDLIYLNEGNGVTELSRDPDAMLRKRLGFTVPLSSLRYWILGAPDPAMPSIPVAGAAGAPAGFRQAGWRITPDKLASIEGWMLPQKLRADGAGVKLKILADNWEIRN